ncbi:MAG: hypothetical protein WC634_03000 [archaeon]
MVLENGNLKVAIVYVALQVLIWIKCAAFFVIYGAGRVTNFNAYLFPPDAVFFNWVFHETMHVAILVLALLFGKNLKRVEWLKLVATVFVAVAVHNVAYWFTNSHSSVAYSAVDFASDSVLLFAAVLAGYALKKTWMHFGKKSGREKV